MCPSIQIEGVDNEKKSDYMAITLDYKRFRVYNRH